MEDLDLKEEERVKLPEGWNSYDGTWIKKDDFKDKNGGEINDIEQKIKKFIELLNKVKVSEFEGGITNFCFKFPDIVKDIFGTKCELVKRGGFFSKATTKSTNPFDYKDFCDAIFSFIDGCFTNAEKDAEAKKQNYCLLMDRIFLGNFIGYDGKLAYDSTKNVIQTKISEVFNKSKWEHMPKVSSMFMEKLCDRINRDDIKKYTVKVVLENSSKNDGKEALALNEYDQSEVSKYGSIIIGTNYVNEDNKENGDKDDKIKKLNELKLSYYKALLKNKLDENKSDEFFKNIPFIGLSQEAIQKNKFANLILLYTNENQLQDKTIQSELVSLPEKIIESGLSAKDKSGLLISLFDKANNIPNKYSTTCLNMTQAAMENLLKLINNTKDESDISYLSDALNLICSFAVSKNQKDAYAKVSQAFISVVSSINMNNFKNLLKLLRGDTKKEPSKCYFNAINEAAKKLATVKEAKQATYKLAHLLDLVKCKEEKDENENSQDQDQKENTSNKKEDSENQKDVEIVNKNINSDIFQSLFEAINKCYPLLNDKNEFNSDDFKKRNESRNILFENFRKVDKKLKGATNACSYVVKKIMDEDISDKIKNENDGNNVRSELEFVIRVIIDGRKKIFSRLK